MSLADTGGWVGTVLVLAAFAWVTRTKRADVWFHLANLVGAGLLAVDFITIRSFPGIVLNVAWFNIAAVGLVQLWRQAYHDTVRLEREAIRANLTRYGDIPVIVDPHCPPGSVFLLDGNCIVGDEDAVGTLLDPRTWQPVRGRDSHPVYGTDRWDFGPFSGGDGDGR